jgi:hypothetical protein
MNEIQLIRGQLATERAHAAAVAEACLRALDRDQSGVLTEGSPLQQFRKACVDYLVRVLTSFEERDQRLSELVHAQLAPEDATRRALEQVLARHGRSREALEKLEAACASAQGSTPQHLWRAFVQHFNDVWGARRDAVEALLAPNTRVGDWRAMGGIDADSILEERRSYARVCAMVPAGVMLPPPPGLKA